MPIISLRKNFMNKHA